MKQNELSRDEITSNIFEYLDGIELSMFDASNIIAGLVQSIVADKTSISVEDIKNHPLLIFGVDEDISDELNQYIIDYDITLYGKIAKIKLDDILNILDNNPDLLWDIKPELIANELDEATKKRIQSECDRDTSTRILSVLES